MQLHKDWKKFIKNDNPAAAALLSKMGYAAEERVQVKFEFLKIISRMKRNPAKMTLLHGFFETYLKLDEEEEKEMQAKIKQLEEDETELLYRLPNSYFEKGLEKGIEKVIKRILLNDMPKAEIAKITGLSLEKLEKMAEE
ncbi:hypothetical protein ACDX78_20410 [Virgibacillus oceani]